MGHADAAPAEVRIVALVNGRPIRSEELDKAAAAELRDLEEKAYQLRRGILENQINRLLVEEAAKEQNLSVPDFMRRFMVVKEVADREIQEVYEKTRAQSPTSAEFEAKEQIRAMLEQRRRQESYRDVVRELRRRAAIEIYLSRPLVATERVDDPWDPAIGPEKAPLTLVMFSDFGCLYCLKAQPVLKQLLAKYEGQIRLVYKNFPSPNQAGAGKDAEAALCAHKQGKFWEYHDVLFSFSFSQSRDLSASRLKEAAWSVGLDSPAFDACLDSKEMSNRVAQDRAKGVSLGVRATPTFFLEGQLLRGVQSIEEFEITVRQLLHKGVSPETR